MPDFEDDPGRPAADIEILLGASRKAPVEEYKKFEMQGN